MAGAAPVSRWSRFWFLVKRALLYMVASCAAAVLLVSLMALPLWQSIRTDTIELLDKHIHHEVAHPGWSFPGTIWSAPIPMTLDTERLIDQAKIRDYTPQCPAKKPGEYCEETETVIPRGGTFPKGKQPDINGEWTIPPALEPVRIAPLLGPDSEWRLHLPYEEAPEILIQALLASEDSEFYEHSGVNFSAFFRAAMANAQGGSYQQGASTLSMQLYRNLSSRTEKTVQRKLLEMAAAITLDTYLGKKGVIQMYLDTPYLGQNGSISICGFEAAAQYYFSVPAAELSLAQAATLVGILPAPGRYRPDKYPERAKQRRDLVLQRIQSVYGLDTSNAMSEPIQTTIGQLPETKHPAYVQAVRQWLNDNLSPMTTYGTGLNVFTGLDLVLQSRTEDTIAIEKEYLRALSGLPSEPKLEGAAVLIDIETGYLSAVYGGTVEASTDFSRATQAKRQAGSSFKPMVYALALEQTDSNGKPQWTTFDTLPNERRTFRNTNGWTPRNNGGKYSETTTLSRAVAISQNVATASLLEQLGGPLPLIDFADRLGFDTMDFPEELGLALGQAEVTPLEMARMSAIIANGGFWVSGQPVQAAIDITGKNHVQEKARGERVISEYTSTLTRELMRLVITAGTGGSARGTLGKRGYTAPAIGKTGTTDKNKDLWFVGATPFYSSALWLGYDIPDNLHASASDFSAPIWGWWMRAIHTGYDRKREFEGLEFRRAGGCAETGQYGNETCKLVAISLLKGQRIKGSCPIEHPPEDPEKKYQSLWQRKSIEQ